ncbi:MAG TPA: DNA-directed RNA polymerase subunit alpha [Candidatus Xenobia bacterium]
MLDPIEPKIEFMDDNTFAVEPLERGFGTTLGVALRRVLLSSLPGAAVTHIKIDGVLHEFSTIPGVVEDTTEIVLNLKKLNLKLHTDRRKMLRLEVTGEGRVTAADIQADPEVEILNPDLHLCTLDAKTSRLHMEIYVDHGVGYVAADRHTSMEATIGLIPIDAIFSPIRKVNYLVEDTRVQQKTDYDKLILEVHTDGSIQAFEAISSAARILHQRLSIFATLQRPEPGAEEAEKDAQSSILDLPVEQLGLSVRSLNCLKRAGIRTVGDLTQYAEEDVMKLKNFGQKSLDEIKEKLQEHGMSLRQTASDE